jgi:arginyl-tRNA synthetase
MTLSSSQSLQHQLVQLLRSAVESVVPDAPIMPTLERPRQADHGDYSCTVALQLAKVAKRPPRELAQSLLAALPKSPLLEKTELAGPGFINLFLAPAARQTVIHEVLTQGCAWGRVDFGHQRPIQVEFVSSNPTGPLHVGHGRGAAFGASLANLLGKAGFKVQREYYVNDAGRQMDILTVSTWLRYLSSHGSSLPFPPNGYQGDYVVNMAKHLQNAFGDRLVRPDEEVVRGAPGVRIKTLEEDIEADRQNEHHMDVLIANAHALLADDYRKVHQLVLDEQLADCRDDLESFGVVFDEWFSEQSLYDDGSVASVVEQLRTAGHLYEQDGALWFKSTDFGDEKDRVVQRENGLHTYFASDIAYHANKFARGFHTIVDVWGADHHGYIPRVKAALTALGLDASRMEVPLVQFVSLFRHGEKVQMSTRKGQYVTLRELRTEVGRDAARFFYVLRKSDQHLDFDLGLAKSQSNDNPVYYVQYAHARIHSVLSKWGGDPASLTGVDCSPLLHPREFALMQALREYPEMIEAAARDYAPHMVAFYLKDLASNLHGYYNAEQFLVDDEALMLARLALITAVATVLKDGLSLLGVSAPVSM